MTTPPDFSVGQTLTSATMNQVGLWKVTPSAVTNGTIGSDGTVTVGTAVGGVRITCFNSNYDNYRIIASDIDCTAGDTVLSAYFGTYTGTGHYGNLRYYNLSTGAGNLPVSNYGLFYVGITGTESDTMADFDVISPNKANRTFLTGGGFGWIAEYSFAAMVATTTQYTHFDLFPAAGTMTGGSIRVYGYRN